jgi:hypothetical protein
MASQARARFKPGRFVGYTYTPETWEGWCVAGVSGVMIAAVVLGLRYLVPDRAEALPFQIVVGCLVVAGTLFVAHSHTNIRKK